MGGDEGNRKGVPHFGQVVGDFVVGGVGKEGGRGAGSWGLRCLGSSLPVPVVFVEDHPPAAE